MFRFRILVPCCFVALAAFVSMQLNFAAQSSSETTWPADIYPESGSRLPPIKRDDMDEQGKKQYDALVGRTGGRSIAGLRGPGGLNLYSPKAALHLSGLSNYLRYESGMSGRVREIAILTTAREFDNQFEWAAHEAVALKEGVPKEVVAVIKSRKDTDGLSEADATIIQLGRQAIGEKKVSSDVFARAQKLFGDRGLVELVMLMGNYSAIAVLLTTFDVQLSPGQKPLLSPR